MLNMYMRYRLTVDPHPLKIKNKIKKEKIHNMHNHTHLLHRQETTLE